MSAIHAVLKPVFLAVLLTLFAANPVHAFGLGDLGGGLVGGLLGGDDKLGAQQDKITGALRSALLNLAKSQALMAKALGLDEKAMLAEQNAANLEKSGDLGADVDWDKVIENSAAVQEAVAEEAARKTVLDAGSKVVFVSSVPFYIKGVLGSVQTGKDAAAIGQSMGAKPDLSIITKAGALLTIIKNLPTLISSLSGSTGKIIDFMTVNEIDTSEMDGQLANAF